MKMKVAWLMFLLKFSARISGLKQRMIMANFFGTIFLIARIFFLEVFLMLVSLPAYIFVKPESLALDAGGGKEAVQQFKLRRVLAFSTMVLMFLVWVGMELSVGGIGNTLLFGGGKLRFEQSAENNSMVLGGIVAFPSGAKADDNGVITFRGRGAANASLLVFVEGEQALVYRVNTDNEGDWSFPYSQKDGIIMGGKFAVYAVTLDENGFAASLPGPVSDVQVSLK